MKKMLVVLAVCLMGIVAQAGLVDDFSGNLSNWTSTVILDNSNPSVHNTSAWEITSGRLDLNTTVRDGSSVEQWAMIYNGLSLGVGQEVQIDIANKTGSQDLGLYVGGTAPTFNVRQNYIAMYARDASTVYSRGFNGTAEYALAGGGSKPYDKLFIKNVDGANFETGYYLAGVRTILATRTPTTTNAATYVGIYADVRGTGILGYADNLTIVPEPATLVLLGLGGLLLKRRRA